MVEKKTDNSVMEEIKEFMEKSVNSVEDIKEQVSKLSPEAIFILNKFTKREKPNLKE